MTPDPVVQGATDILESLIEEAKSRLDNPKQLKKLSFTEILTHIELLIKAVKQNKIILSKTAQVNLGTIHNTFKNINASPARKQELRVEARKQLKHLPG